LPTTYSPFFHPVNKRKLRRLLVR